ncbi:hypothetical protein B0H17DRAFT_1128606 [Mycena rosella]|uniref:Uncharacterized protein n=1 Tax=Mycena rosella TaxID=1033263 RepID=A0AAD7DVI6_MYCRO|nr:hypothetical protein B0H17DRAFT_1128606 [Mycena rosella]
MEGCKLPSGVVLIFSFGESSVEAIGVEGEDAEKKGSNKCGNLAVLGRATHVRLTQRLQTTHYTACCAIKILEADTASNTSQTTSRSHYSSPKNCAELPARSVEVWLCVATRLAQPGDGRLVPARSIFVEACDARLDWAGGGG